MRTEISTDRAPEAIGPYSQAVVAGGHVYVSGQLPIDPKTGEFPGLDIETQTKQSLLNIEAILNDAGFTMDDVVKCSIFLENMGDFIGMNAVYAGFFIEPYPARSTFAVKTLPKNALVEIEIIAFK